MAVTKKLLLPKIIGTGVISAVMAIGFYVLILDLPEIKTNSSVATTSETVNTNAKPVTSEITEKSESIEENEEENNEINEDSSTSTTTTPNTAPSQNTGTTAPTNPTTPTTPTSPVYKYNNNSYTKSASYDVEGKGLTWTLTATIVIENDTVKDVSTQQPGTTGQSLSWYDRFASNILTVVKGKNIDGLSVSRVGGATYTSYGFNSVLNLVRQSAQK